MLKTIKLTILIQQKTPVRNKTHPVRLTNKSNKKAIFIFSKIFITNDPIKTPVFIFVAKLINFYLNAKHLTMKLKENYIFPF